MLGTPAKYIGPTLNGEQAQYGRADVDGLPVVGDLFARREAEYQQAQPVAFFKRRMFKLWEPADEAAYADVMDHVCNSVYVIVFMERHYDTEHHEYRVCVEWAERARALPPRA